MRFQKDCISWEHKRDAIVKDFKGQLIDGTICEEEYDAPAHSVLIGERFSKNTIHKDRSIDRKKVENFLNKTPMEPDAQCSGS